MLRNHKWKLKYTLEDGDLNKCFYVPALEDARRYDRISGYFTATALALAARGIESLVCNEGRMRLVVGCTLKQPEIEAIKRGEQVRTLVEQNLRQLPLTPPDLESNDALELLAWMVACGILEVKVAVPCNEEGLPTAENALLHAKTGIIMDRMGDRIAWTGSLNETGAGWRNNWESIHVYTSWGSDLERVVEEEENFARIWLGEAQRLIVLDVPEAVRKELLRFKPNSGLPKRLESTEIDESPENLLRDRVWKFIQGPPSQAGNSQSISESTAPVLPWPHQIRAFERLNRKWPPRLLIADEVGLGKTIQAGLLLRQAWLDGRAKRILILAPKAVLKQWQVELRDKFNLNWPIYDDGKLSWHPSPALQGQNIREVGRDQWHREPIVIASSQLMRRADRALELQENAEPWDLLVLDEAHHARRRAAASSQEDRPNALLKLMRTLKDRTKGLILMTATPMQVHPIEVWDLLDLLGLPSEWNSKCFLDFFEDANQFKPSVDTFEQMALQFQAIERAYGETKVIDVKNLVDLSQWSIAKILRVLRGKPSIPRRKLEADERRGAVAIMRTETPVRRLISRNTRDLLRHYHQRGMMKMSVANRHVDDCFLKLTQRERVIYDAVEDYIATVYDNARVDERNAVGFIMTVYRRRLASSFNALSKTLQKRRNTLEHSNEVKSIDNDIAMSDDIPDDETTDDILDIEELNDLARKALQKEEHSEIEHLLSQIQALPPDSKLDTLKTVLTDLNDDGYQQVMIFTQYTDTMEFLRDSLQFDSSRKLMCFSGRGGEVFNSIDNWQLIGREDAKRRFRNGDADLLICTDAAAEGLNFQFCGAMVNYDMPWNPMRVEQRIGRIDRLGQEFSTIRIVNMHYEGTIEANIYRVLGERIDLFKNVVGRLQPILARLPSTITQSVLTGKNRNIEERANIFSEIETDIARSKEMGFDIDGITESNLNMPDREPSIITMEDLNRIITSENLMSDSIKIQQLGAHEYGFSVPGRNNPIRVTTDPRYFEEHTEDMEFWSPGNPLFIAPDYAADVELDSSQRTLKDILDSG